MTPPPVSETAAWTENDELLLKEQPSWKPGSRAGEQPLPRFAREIRRLRAENERLTKLQAPKLTCATCRREQPYHSMYRCFQCEAWFDHGHMASHLAHTHNVGESREIVALRSELAAATRERETPPDDSQPAPQRCPP